MRKDDAERLSAEHDKMVAYIIREHGESVLADVLAGPHPSKRPLDMTSAEKDAAMDRLCAELER